jgi:uracil-DNA glycosylase
MLFELNKDWRSALEAEMSQPYFKQLTDFLQTAYDTKTIYPPKKEVFNALNRCALANVKVVILGQDPYHGPGQAHGLSFSVNDGVKFPPSLVNIFKALAHDLDEAIPISGNLERWANQGVLLLNASLTVEKSLAGSHQGKGWETFTDAIIQHIADNTHGIVFMLWGAYAQKKSNFIDAQKHLVLKAVHPSPLSAYRGFLTCQHFSQANAYLVKHGKDGVAW